MSVLNPIEAALQALRSGLTLLYPTDTIWGIGCDATDPAAVEKIYQIKQRDHSKSMLLLMADEAMLRRYIPQPEPRALELLLTPDRPTTVIFPLGAPTALAENLPASDHSVGIRIPRHDFCQQLLHLFGKPIVSTSANFSGEPSPASYDEISDRLKERIDCLVPDRPEYRSGNSQGSRIVKVSPTGEILTIRP